MKKLIQILLMFCISLSIFTTNPVRADVEDPFFLLGQNEKAEVVAPSGKTVTLELGKNPIQVLTNNSGQKIVLCGGLEEKSGEIKQGASLRLITKELNSYEKTLQCDSALTGFAVNHDLSIIWLATQGGSMKKEVIKPKIYRVDANTLSATETVLDSLPCEITLSGDDKCLAVASLGEAEKPSSVLTLFEADTMKTVSSFAIAKNPGILNFSNDNNTLVVAGYGYSESGNSNANSNGTQTFVIPTPHFMKLKKTTPAGINVINLVSQDNRLFELGVINEEFVSGTNATVYSIAKDNNKGTVTAIDPSGLLWGKKYEYVPKYVQERPGTSQVFVIGGKNISIIDNTSCNTVKEITADTDIQPFNFLDNSSYAYSYNMGKLKLTIMDLDSLVLEKSIAAGSSGLAVFKKVTMVLSVFAYADSLQPQYVGGVQMPTHVSSIYWAHTPKGNMVPSPDQKKLYMLNSFMAEIYTYDLQKGVVAKKLGYLGEKTLYLQMAPNGKYVILVAGDDWKLVNTVTDKADLTFSVGSMISFAFQAVTAPTPYFSPNGNTMYIPDGSKVMVIDLQNGKKLAPIATKTKDALIYW